MSELRRFAPDRVQTFIASAFERVGLAHDDAQSVAALMTEADVQGSDGHGIIRLPQYVTRIEAGGVNVRPNIRVTHERTATALIDGDNGMGHLIMKRAAEIAIAKAKTSGIAWVGSVHSNHAGPASLYARMALAEGMVGLYFAVGNANHLPPWGGMDMLLSTNPIAVAIPADTEPPIVLDMATTVAAYGKVKARAQKGEAMPEGWMIDRQGHSLTDPKRAAEGFLLPLGGAEAGYKGYGLSLVFGILAGTLNGAAMGKAVIDFNADQVTPTNTGQAVAMIDPGAFGDPQRFRRNVDILIREMRGSSKLPGVSRVWLPGEQSFNKRSESLSHGVPVASALCQALDALADRLQLPRLA
jgi:L-2-hydroxycarboxylate dehydrogenase (NAD+)